MPHHLPTPMQARNEVGAACRSGDEDRIARARQMAAFVNIATDIERRLATSTLPLTARQREYLGLLLKGRL